MLQQTVRRLDGLEALQPILICHEDQRFLAAEQMRLLGRGETTIILEPINRNTAPAIALAALYATRAGDDDPVVLALAADHVIGDMQRFREALADALPLAEQGKLVTFGVIPNRPETGYGYIKRGRALKTGFAVESFVEKPDRETAECCLTSGDHYWNSGMFMFRASQYLNMLKRYSISTFEACAKAAAEFARDTPFLRINGHTFTACPEGSIDHVVLEKCGDLAVVPLDAGWSDIGSWSALLSVHSRDTDGNAFRGDVLSVETANTLAHAEDRLVALLGVRDLVVIETKDAVLVAHRDEVQRVREIVQEIKRQSRQEHLTHCEVYRPWGRYVSIDIGDRYKVKRITVRPGARLSLQRHHHRAEHWIVVRGTARVRKGSEMILLTENQSTYIPLGETHAIENPGKIPLELIEVQSGAYLDEDDIERIDECYGAI